ncbi:alkaline phosphatase [Oceanicaulis alexandrii]|uniref:alkaline phosphatase n=1 Tax=Oceanicaulis alexandrii TaxID=153233 RepID=UPI0003B605A2|nr:alkaline phosphatase [Oceanicaulis alexandrii]HCR65733.1 alkaline phosphatase [Oceanicaulis sp.]
MIVRAILLSVSALALTACQSVNVQSDIDWSGRDDDAPEAAAVAPAEFDGPGADWRTLAQSEILDRLARPEREGRARNVIVFIGDGLNLSTITAARILDGQNRGMSGEENYLPFERWGHSALIKTYSDNAQVPDSAATATAIHAGVKTHSGAISVYARDTIEPCQGGPVPQTLVEMAEARGLSTGIVSSARLTHATPATTYAHVTSRNWETDTALPADAAAAGCTDIAAQLIGTRTGEYGDGLDLALGGGRAAFVTQEQGGQRADRDLTAEWANLGGVYIEDRAGFDALDADDDAPVLGLFTNSHLSFELDRDAAVEPSLAELTEFAIERLSNNDDGYYLLVEGGRIDHAHHGANAARALNDALAFSEAIDRAQSMVDLDETLILVTADHGHVFTIAGYPRRGNPILGLVRPPAPNLSDAETPPLPAGDGRPYTTLGYHNGGPLRPRGDDAEPLTDEIVMDPDYRQQAAVPMGSETHSGEDVIAYAVGPWAHLVDGSMEQHTLHHVITHAYGWSATAAMVDADYDDDEDEDDDD